MLGGDSSIWHSFDYIPMHNRLDLISAYSELIQQYVDEAYKPFLLTFLFKQLRGTERSVIRQMLAETQTIYQKLITHVVRDPTRKTKPVFIASSDKPVPKCEKKKMCEVAFNDGLHVHAIALIPPRSRLKVDLQTHFRNHESRYLTGTSILKIHVEPIKPTAPDITRVTDYVLKSFKRGRMNYDDAILVLPKAVSEIRCS
jgi:hypothetical protein